MNQIPCLSCGDVLPDDEIVVVFDCADQVLIWSLYLLRLTIVSHKFIRHFAILWMKAKSNLTILKLQTFFIRNLSTGFCTVYLFQFVIINLCFQITLCSTSVVWIASKSTVSAVSTKGSLSSIKIWLVWFHLFSLIWWKKLRFGKLKKSFKMKKCSKGDP